MTSESTRFLGQPSETKPTLGRVWAGASRFRSLRIARGVTDFHFSKFARLERPREASWGGISPVAGEGGEEKKEKKKKGGGGGGARESPLAPPEEQKRTSTGGLLLRLLRHFL